MARIVEGEARAVILAHARDLFLAEGSPNVSMRRIAKAVGVTPMALYRHFDTKRNLFKALGSELYRQSTAGAPLNSLDDLLGFLPALYEQFLGHEGTIRWNMAAPSDEMVRPSATERTPILRTALEEQLAALPRDEADHLLRAAMLMTSATAVLYWKDYLDISMEEAAETARWMLRRLADS